MTFGAIVTPAPGMVGAHVAACKRAGYASVQVNLSSPPTEKYITEILDACKAGNLELAALGAYGNPMQPFSRAPYNVSAEDIRGLLEFLPHRREEDGPWLIVCYSGTLSGDLFTPHPGNQSPGALAELGRWCDAQLMALEKKNAVLLFKPHYCHILSEHKRLKQFFAAKNDPSLGCALDLCNFLSPKVFHERENMIVEAAKMLAPYTALVHVKDARIENFRIELTGPGQGQMGMAGMLKQLWRYERDSAWMVDGVEGELQLRRAREYMDLQANLAGIV